MANQYPPNPNRQSRAPVVIGQRKGTDKMTGPERAELITKLRAKGFKAGTLNAIIKASATREEIVRGLAAVMTEAGTIPV
jgi:hypothetical protein